MAQDYFLTLHKKPLQKKIATSLGLPVPLPLKRTRNPWQANELAGQQIALLTIGETNQALSAHLQQAGASVSAQITNASELSAIILDATQITALEELKQAFTELKKYYADLRNNRRIIILGPMAVDPEPAVLKIGMAKAVLLSHALDGLMRSLSKECGRKNIAVNAVKVDPGAEHRVSFVVQFLLSKRSAYVAGQPIPVSTLAHTDEAVTTENILQGKRAVVTGAGQGIGLSVAQFLKQEGADVIGIDHPSSKTIDQEMQTLGAQSIKLDIGQAAIGEAFVKALGSPVDIVIHNAGITRDKMFKRMTSEQWDLVTRVDLDAIVEINDALLAADYLNDHGRLIFMSSISGIAGNAGQTNYATSKSGLIAYALGLSHELAARGITVNAIAPGFIETKIVETMPFMNREVGRRMSVFKQGGIADDIAHATTMLAAPGASGITGYTLRVCGHMMIGA